MQSLEKRPKREGFIPVSSRVGLRKASTSVASSSASSVQGGASRAATPNSRARKTPVTPPPPSQASGSNGATELKDKNSHVWMHAHEFPSVGASPSGLVQSPRVGAAPTSPVPKSNQRTREAASPNHSHRSPQQKPTQQHRDPARQSPSQKESMKWLKDQVHEAEQSSKEAFEVAVSANQDMLDMMNQRRQRAITLMQLYREEARDTEMEIARREEEQKVLQSRRRELVELSRSLELQVYQNRKQHNNHMLGQRGSHQQHPVAVPSTRYTETTRVLAPTPAARDAKQDARAEFESLNRRLDAARSVTQDLRREIEKTELNIKSKEEERLTFSAMSEQLEKDVAELEKHEVFVNGVVRESKEVIKSAGAMVSRTPYLQRQVAELESSIKSVRADFHEVEKQLMNWIESDDALILELRQAAEAKKGNFLPSIIRQLQSENDALQQAAHATVEKAEQDRVELQRVADGLQQRLQGLEDKIRVMEMSAATSAVIKGGISPSPLSMQ